MRKLTILAGLVVAAVSVPSLAHELTLKVGNIKKLDGNILVAVYDQASHYDSNSQWVAAQKVKVTPGPILITLGDLPAGNYAVKLFQDENDNGQIDLTTAGYPTEPYGFSNNGGNFGPPSFDEAKVRLEKKTEIEIHLR